MNESTNQPINQSIKQASKQASNQSVDEGCLDRQAAAWTSSVVDHKDEDRRGPAPQGSCLGYLKGPMISKENVEKKLRKASWGAVAALAPLWNGKD